MDRKSTVVHFNLSKQLKVFSESGTQLRLELCLATKKLFRRRYKIRKLLKVFIVPNLLIEELP
jgi:hypothetical protein